MSFVVGRVVFNDKAGLVDAGSVKIRRAVSDALVGIVTKVFHEELDLTFQHRSDLELGDSNYFIKLEVESTPERMEKKADILLSIVKDERLQSLKDLFGISLKVRVKFVDAVSGQV